MESVIEEVKTNYTKNGFRWWLGTWNNPPDDYVERLKCSGAKFGRGQKEIGAQGTTHCQFVLFFKDSLSFTKVKSITPDGIHIDGKPGAAKKSICDYVWKDETSIPDTRFEWGEAQSINRAGREKYDDAFEKCRSGELLEIDKEILVKHLKNCLALEAMLAIPYESPRCRGLWIYGEPGVGKSHYARNLYNVSYYIKSQNKWWCSYRGERVVLLEDFDSAALGHLVKIWADKWSCVGEIKGGSVNLQHTDFVITSNYLPSELWGATTMAKAVQRRFIFVNIRYDVNGERRIVSGADYGTIPQSEEIVDRTGVYKPIEYLPGMFI